MLTLDDILTNLVQNYKRNIPKQQSYDISSQENIIDLKYEIFNGETYDIFFKCLCAGYYTNGIIDQNLIDMKISTILNFLIHNAINKHINRRKIINHIKLNNVTNDLILFLSGYLDCNIWIYYQDNKIFKVYYLEDKLDINKKNVFIVYGLVNQLTLNKGYGIGFINNNTKIDFNDTIKKIIDNYIIIPIGLKENKKLELGNNQLNPLYQDIEILNQLISECSTDIEYYLDNFNFNSEIKYINKIKKCILF